MFPGHDATVHPTAFLIDSTASGSAKLRWMRGSGKTGRIRGAALAQELECGFVPVRNGKSRFPVDELAEVRLLSIVCEVRVYHGKNSTDGFLVDRKLQALQHLSFLP